MKKFLPALIITALFASCFNPLRKTIDGDGNVSTTERNLSSFKNIKCEGSYDVEVSLGSPSSIKIETDGNLQSYILTDVNGDNLDIHTKNDLNLKPSQKIKLIIVTDKLEGFKLSGAGSIKSTNKITGGDHLDLDISGSGDMHFDVNTPNVDASISGTGDIYVSGEAKDSKIDIAGNGNFHAEDLKTENTKIKIAGSGDADVFADGSLDINIAGVGNVNYKGNASVSQNVAGSGKIKKIE